MAAYEGETLKERIERGPLKLDDAIDIATQVGQAQINIAGIRQTAEEYNGAKTASR